MPLAKQECCLCTNLASSYISKEKLTDGGGKYTIGAINLCGIHLAEAEQMGIEAFLEKYSGYTE